MKEESEYTDEEVKESMCIHQYMEFPDGITRCVWCNKELKK